MGNAYHDPTFNAVWGRIRREGNRNEYTRFRRAIKQAKEIIRENGFELVQPIVLRAITSGRVYDGRKKQ